MWGGLLKDARIVGIEKSSVTNSDRHAHNACAREKSVMAIGIHCP